MTEVASAYVTLLPSARGFGAKLNSEVSGDVNRSGKSLGGAFGKMFVAAAALGIGAKIATFLGDTVKSASDAQQSLGATETVFGRFADTVVRRSKDAAQAVGLSANEYRELANQVGAGLRGAGIPLKQTTQLTDQLNKRAADMAATFGGTTREAIEAVSSALRGETDPIERYGVAILESDINARLAAQGQDKLTGEALKSAKMQARLDLIMQKTALTQGAFAKESDTLAGAQQRLSGSWENMKSTIGTALLPMLTQLASWVNTTVLPALSRLGEWVRTHVSPVLSQLGGFIRNQLAPALRALAEDYLEGVRRAFAELSKKGKDGKSTLDQLKKAFNQIWPVIRDDVLPAVGEFYKVYLPALAKVLGLAIRQFNQVITVIRVVGSALVLAGSKVREFTLAVRERMSAAVEFIRTVPSKIKAAFGDPGALLRGIGSQIIAGLVAGINAAKDRVLAAVNAIIDKIPKAIRDKMGISSPSKVTTQLGIYIGEGLAVGIEASSKKAEKATEKLVEKIRKKLDAKQGLLSDLRNQFTSIKDTVAGAFTQNLFEGSTVAEWTANLLGTKGQLGSLLAAFKTLKGWGLKPEFLSQLFASGNGGLILDLAAQGQAGAQSSAALFGEVVDLSNTLGGQVARNELGEGIRDVRDEIRELRKDLKKHAKDVSDGVAAGVNGAATNGTRDRRGRRGR